PQLVQPLPHALGDLTRAHRRCTVDRRPQRPVAAAARSPSHASASALAGLRRRWRARHGSDAAERCFVRRRLARRPWHGALSAARRASSLRILLSGYYGLGNLGDEAILAGLAGALRERGHAPLVLSGDPAATEAEHGLLARHRTRGLLGALASADVVVSGGGGLLQDKTSARSLSYYLWIVRLARWFGRPVAVYGQSFGPLSPAGRARVQRELRGVPLFLRDQQSLRLAADLGLDASLVGDAALLLERPRPQGGTRRGAEPARSPGGDPHVGAGPVVLVPRGGDDQYNGVLERPAPSLQAAGRSLA